MKRISLLASLGAVAVLGGCKEPQPAEAKAAAGFIRGGEDIAIKETRIYPTSDAVAGTSDQYYVIRFGFTNDLGIALRPKIDHFVIEDLAKVRYLGVDSGATALVGISNYDGVLQKGDAHEYTVGFRVPINTQGQLFYDATF